MNTFLIILFLTSTLVVLGLGWYWHRRFAATPARRWANRVRQRHLEFADRLQQLRRDDNLRWDPRSLERKLFDRQLANLPISRLDAYVGIGPGTIDLLRSARLRSIADLQGYRFESLHGIGAGKADALRKATRSLVTDARAAFDAGSSNEGREFRQAVRDERDREDRERRIRVPQIAALEAALAENEASVKISNRIHLLAFLLGQATGFTDALATEELPSADDIMAAARPMFAPPRLPAPTAQVAPLASPRPAPPVTPTPERIPPAPLPEPANPLLGEMRFFASLGIFVARADGEFTHAEQGAIRQLLGHQYGHDPSLVRHLDAVLEAASQGSLTRTGIAVGFNRHCVDQADKRRAYHFAMRIAEADGKRHEREESLLAWLAEALGLKVEVPSAAKPAATVSARPAMPPASGPAKPFDPFLDRSVPVVSPATSPPPGLEAMRFFASLGIFIARADGKIAAAERQEVRRFLDGEYSHDAVLVRHIDAVIEEVERGKLTASDLTTGLSRYCLHDAAKRKAYNYALRVVDAASGRTEREIAKLKWLADVLGLSSEASPVPVNAPAVSRPVAKPTTIPQPAPAARSPVIAAPITTAAVARENSLLDEAFADLPPAAPPPTITAGDMRENALLDDVFGA